MERSERTLVLVAGGVLVLIVAAILAVASMGSDDITEFPIDTPEGVVQRYLQLSNAGRTEEALTYMSSAARAEINKQGPFAQPCRVNPAGRVRIGDVTEATDTATVQLLIESGNTGGMFSEQHSWAQPVSLVREDGVWKINDPYLCL